jgi:hypothetical protein
MTFPQRRKDAKEKQNEEQGAGNGKQRTAFFLCAFAALRET